MTVDKAASAVQRALLSRTLQEFLEHGRHISTKTFGFPSSFAEFTYYSSQHIFLLARQATRIYRDAGLRAPVDGPDTAAPVVGLRAISTVEWVVTFLSLARIGYTVLVLSPTLPVSTVGALMAEAGCDVLVDGTGDLSELKHLDSLIIALATMDDLKNCSSMEQNGLPGPCCPTTRRNAQEADAAIIVHSSGTTGLPKLIRKSHKEMMSRLRAIPAICHDKSFFIGSWLYYMVGMYSMLLSFVKSGGPTCWANEKLPLVPEAYREILLETRPQMAYFNPVTLIAASSTAEGLQMLQKCMMVTTTGEVFPEQMGNRLVKSGVHLANEYGMTELAFGLSSATRAPGDPDWEYLAADPSTAPHIQLRPLSDGESSTWAGGEQLYELIVLPSHPTQDKSWATHPDGSFHTGDVFMKHPTKPRYKCMGRLCDDVKICPEHDLVGLNALEYEHRAKDGNADLLDEATLFGNQRPEAGFLLFVKRDCVLSDEDVLQRVWSTVEEHINDVLPVKIAKHMLVVVRDAIVPRTPKGSIIRPEIYLKFERLVDRAYEGRNEAVA